MPKIMRELLEGLQMIRTKFIELSECHYLLICMFIFWQVLLLLVFAE